MRSERSQFRGDTEGGGGGSTTIGATGMSVPLCQVLVSGTYRPAEASGPTTEAEGPPTGGGEGAGAGTWHWRGAEVLTNWLRLQPQELITSSRKVNMTLLRRGRG